MVSDVAVLPQAGGEVDDDLIALAEEVPFCDQDPDQALPLGVLIRERVGLKLLDQAEMDEAIGTSQAVDLFGGDRVIDPAMGNSLTAELLLDFRQGGGEMSQENRRLCAGQMFEQLSAQPAPSGRLGQPNPVGGGDARLLPGQPRPETHCYSSIRRLTN